MPGVGDVLGIPVVRAESHSRRAELLDEREEVDQIPRHRRLADQEPHARAQSLPTLFDRPRLVVGADAGGGVRIELPAQHAGCMPVDVLGALERELLELGGIAGDHAREVHHLGQADHAAAPEQTLEIAGRQRSARRLVRRRGHARRGHEEDVERQAGADIEQPVDAVGSEDVRDLVGVGDDRRRPHRQHEPRELVHHQLRRLEVEMRVDEPWHDVLLGDIERFRALVLAKPGDVAVTDGDVHLEPLAGEDGQDAAAAHDEIGGLVTPRDCDPAREVVHRPTMSSGRTGTRASSLVVASRSAATTAAVETTVGGSPTPFRP